MNHFDVRSLKTMANGHWPQILTQAGIQPCFLTSKPGPCPFCGGKDRWLFDDKDGHGTGFCRQCDATGDGFRLVAKALHLDPKQDFPTILQFVADQIGASNKGESLQAEKEKVARIRLALVIWNEASILENEVPSPLVRYLATRGLNEAKLSSAVRFHPSLAAYSEGVLVGHFPAMVAAITNGNDEVIGVHRTYLDDQGCKHPALGDHAKQVRGVAKGGGIRLADENGSVIGIAEGIETALSVQVATGLPMLAAPTGSVMAAAPIPEHVNEVHIWADFDLQKAGEKYALQLAQRLYYEGKKVFIHLPNADIPDGKRGVDWNDILMLQGGQPIQDSLASTSAWIKPASDANAWKTPEPLPSLLSPVPRLEPDMLPEGLRPWIEDT